ncbi:hypothetical protein MNBD_GAMMA25-1155 [hydrothermal vent metagenome]|uniref:Type cbb3 cytochrome oxidase biogenesis protein CcoH n=1 Tax=hydrothermal vent metagenome TaxID=652676 RepID=A0A3B1B7P4_9ZZZZ
MTATKVMNSKFISQANKQAMRNPWVLGWIGLVVFVLLVNAGMISMAVITNSGLVEEDYYEKGRDHEKNFLKKQAARHALGWNFKLDVPAELVLEQTHTLRFNVVDKLGLAVNDLDVEVLAYRPSDANADFKLKLESFAPGQYQAQAVFPLKGVWELKLKASQAAESFDLIEQRISVKTH